MVTDEILSTILKGILSHAKTSAQEKLEKISLSICPLVAHTIKDNCSINVVQQIEIITRMHSLFTSWSKFSGDRGYPINVTMLEPRIEYIRVRSGNEFWQGEQRKARIELLEHCISELERDLQNGT